MDNVLLILKDARSIVDTGFCKGAYAKRGNGLSCKPTDPRAVSHCTVGAIYAAAGLETIDGHDAVSWTKDVQTAVIEIHAAIGIRSYDEDAMATWNNRWYRSKRGVLRAFDRAIAFYESEQASVFASSEPKRLLIADAAE